MIGDKDKMEFLLLICLDKGGDVWKKTNWYLFKELWKFLLYWVKSDFSVYLLLKAEEV